MLWTILINLIVFFIFVLFFQFVAQLPNLPTYLTQKFAPKLMMDRPKIALDANTKNVAGETTSPASKFLFFQTSQRNHFTWILTEKFLLSFSLHSQLINCVAKQMCYPKMMPLNKLHRMKIFCNLSLRSQTIHCRNLPRNCWLIDQKQYRNHIPRMLQTIPHHRKPIHQPHRPVSSQFETIAVFISVHSKIEISIIF